MRPKSSGSNGQRHSCATNAGIGSARAPAHVFLLLRHKADTLDEASAPLVVSRQREREAGERAGAADAQRVAAEHADERERQQQGAARLVILGYSGYYHSSSELKLAYQLVFRQDP